MNSEPSRVDRFPVIADFEVPKSPPRTMPVYENLEEILLDGERKDQIAYALATCCGYAYSDWQTFGRTMAWLGLEGATVQILEEIVDEMSIHSTAYLVQSKSKKIAILCYRGTALSAPLNWLTNADISAQEFRFNPPATPAAEDTAWVHRGWYRNVEATFPGVLDFLQREKSRLEKLYITGHSLGGAMAVLAAAKLANEHWPKGATDEFRKAPIQVRTFGQPMVGNSFFAEDCEKLKPGFELHRYIHRYDIVARLPSADVKGKFQHFGEWTFLGGTSDEENNEPPPAEEAQEILSQIAAGFLQMSFHAWLESSLENIIPDNQPSRYILKQVPGGLKKAGSEITNILVKTGSDAVEAAVVIPKLVGDMAGRLGRKQGTVGPPVKNPTDPAGTPTENWPPQAPTILDVFIAAHETLLEKFREFTLGRTRNLYCSIADHDPNFYIDNLRPPSLGLGGDRINLNL